jgi:ubiquitin C-terminal hydrolase
MSEIIDYSTGKMLNSSSNSIYISKKQNRYRFPYRKRNKNYNYTKNRQNNSQIIYRHHAQEIDSNKEGNETGEEDTKESILDIEEKKDSIKLDVKNSEEELSNDKNYENLQKENKNLRILLDNMKNKELEYESKIKNQKIEYEESLKSVKAEYSKKTKEKEAEMKKLKDNIKEYERNIGNLENEIKNKDKIIQDLKIKFENQLSSKDKEINHIKKSLEKTQEQLKNIKNECKLHMEEIKEQKKNIEDLELLRTELEKSLDEQQNKNIVLNDSLEDKEKKFSLINNKFNSIKDALLDIGNLIENKKCRNIENKEEEEEKKEENQEEEEEEEEEEDYKFNEDKNNGKVGLYNEEYNCYMSSVLQVLKNIKIFSSMILKNNKIQDDILISLKKLINSLYYSKQKSVSLLEFKNYFANEYTKFKGKKDNDSTFFLIYLLQYLQKILKVPKRKVTSLSDFSFLKLKKEEKEELYKFLKSYEAKNYSAIHDIFFGYQMSEIICSGCNKLSISFQSFNVLHLSLYDDRTKLTDLVQCINSFLYTKDKKGQEGFECSNCCKKCLSHVISIIKLPPVLIINLKRVGEQNIYNHDIKIPFIFKTNSIEKLKKFNSEYELIGFIKHYGNEKNGHNVAFTKNIFDKKWYYYNDDHVKELRANPSTNDTFLFFYQLINHNNNI